MLDDKRLGKQRVETLQIMQVLTGYRWDNSVGVIGAYEPKGWRNHPAVLMWKGFEPALAEYQRVVCTAWTARGFNDTCARKTAGLLEASGYPTSILLPPWIGQAPLHLSHRSNLIRKDPDVYAPLFVGVPPDLPYVWPVTSSCSPRR